MITHLEKKHSKAMASLFDLLVKPWAGHGAPQPIFDQKVKAAAEKSRLITARRSWPRRAAADF